MENSHKEQCPCWSSDQEGKCTITEGGVYLPLAQHIWLFCLSAEYASCSRYIQGRECIANREALERRRFRRYEKKCNIAIDVCDPTDGSPALSKYNVRTLDVSLHGMKIESPEKIPTDTIVGFQFDPAFSPDVLAGSGSVKWCRQQAGSEKFEFGLAFYDEPGIHLGINKLLYQ